MTRDQLEKILIKAKVIRPNMPLNYTYNKVREVLTDLESAEEGDLKVALKHLAAFGIKSPLGTVTFLKRHLKGKHTVSVDRIATTEEGQDLAVLDYPEGGLPIALEKLPKGLKNGTKLEYDPESGTYTKR